MATTLSLIHSLSGVETPLLSRDLIRIAVAFPCWADRQKTFYVNVSVRPVHIVPGSPARAICYTATIPMRTRRSVFQKWVMCALNSLGLPFIKASKSKSPTACLPILHMDGIVCEEILHYGFVSQLWMNVSQLWMNYHEMHSFSIKSLNGFYQYSSPSGR